MGVGARGDGMGVERIGGMVGLRTERTGETTTEAPPHPGEDSVQYCTEKYSTMQQSTVQYSTVQNRTAPYSTAQCSAHHIANSSVLSVSHPCVSSLRRSQPLVPCLMLSVMRYARCPSGSGLLCELAGEQGSRAGTTDRLEWSELSGFGSPGKRLVLAKDAAKNTSNCTAYKR